MAWRVKVDRHGGNNGKSPVMLPSGGFGHYELGIGGLSITAMRSVSANTVVLWFDPMCWNADRVDLRQAGLMPTIALLFSLCGGRISQEILAVGQCTMPFEI